MEQQEHREEHALEALIAASFLFPKSLEAEDFDNEEFELREEDRAALDVRGRGMIEAIISGQIGSEAFTLSKEEVAECDMALNRGGQVDGLSDLASEEIERRIKEFEAEDEPDDE